MSFQAYVVALAGVVMLQAASPQALAASSARQKPAATQAAEPELQLDAAGNPVLGSAAWVIVSQKTGQVIFEKKATSPMPIASITKLMTAMVVLDAKQNLQQKLTVTADDIDRLKGTGSRLPVGAQLTREEMLHLALMSSENRAASALARYYPGGTKAFVEAMNVKARMLGLWQTNFVDSTGLNPANTSTPRDLVNLVQAAATYPLIREFTTSDERHVRVGKGTLRFGNSNSLVRDSEWQVTVSKTGYIREAGRCVVMQTWVSGEPVIMVLMGAEGQYTRTADAKRIKRWLETSGGKRLDLASAAGSAQTQAR